MTVVKIENNTSAWIHLFPTESFPAGIRLGPGLTSVPELYMDEFKAWAVRGEGKGGKPGPERFPGQELLAELLAPIRYYTAEGAKFGPRITIYTDDQAGREDGPAAPQDLRGYTQDQALAAVKFTSDQAALKRWASDTRPAVKAAVLTKLNG